ncbi:MAG: hypothetical protein ACLS3M_02985 [Collinsella sp.]
MAKKPDSFYFDNYVACADLAVQAAELLTKIFENFDPAQIHDMLIRCMRLSMRQTRSTTSSKTPCSLPLSPRSSARIWI